MNNYLTSRKDYSSTQLVMRQKIAALCPYEYGPAVIQARVMLSEIDSTDYATKEDCKHRLHAQFKDKKSWLDTQKDTNYRFHLYPNPAFTEIIIEYGLPEKHRGIVILYDIYGRKVKQVALNNATGRIQLRVNDLPDAIYYYQILIEHTVVSSGKVLILP